MTQGFCNPSNGSIRSVRSSRTICRRIVIKPACPVSPAQARPLQRRRTQRRRRLPIRNAPRPGRRAPGARPGREALVQSDPVAWSVRIACFVHSSSNNDSRGASLSQRPDTRTDRTVRRRQGTVIAARDEERLLVPAVQPLPFKEPVGRNQAASLLERRSKRRLGSDGIAAGETSYRGVRSGPRSREKISAISAVDVRSVYRPHMDTDQSQSKVAANRCPHYRRNNHKSVATTITSNPVTSSVSPPSTLNPQPHATPR